MSSEWPIVPIDQICELIVDCVNKTAPVVEQPTPYRMIRTTNIRNGRIDLSSCRYVDEATYAKWTRRAILQHGDVLLTREAPIGEVGLVDKPQGLFLGQRVMQYRANPAVLSSRFLLYAFLSPALQEQFGSHEGSGSVVSHIRVGDCFKFKVKLPPLTTQTEIAALLGTLDDRITLLRETNAMLEAIAQALFKSWFVDFDPVHAKQQGRIPDGMDEATAALLPDSFEESELGLVPRGWRVQAIGDISEILNGHAFKSEDYVNEDSGVFVLRTTNFSDDGYAKRLSKDVFLPHSFLKSHSKYICEAFDFHLVMVGASVGKTSTLLPHMLPALRNQNMWCFRPTKGFHSKFFIHEIVKLKVIEALRSTSGSAREFFRKGDFEKSLITVPPEGILIDFEDSVSTIKNKIAINENQADLLMCIRDTLLPRLISGQLRLPEAEVEIQLDETVI